MNLNLLGKGRDEIRLFAGGCFKVEYVLSSLV